MEPLPTFSDLIARHRGGRSQDAFSELLTGRGFAVPRQSLSHWENGTHCPSAQRIAKLAEALELTSGGLADLLGAAGRFERVAK